jgi:hypothetical protein
MERSVLETLIPLHLAEKVNGTVSVEEKPASGSRRSLNHLEAAADDDDDDLKLDGSPASRTVAFLSP